MKILVTGGAGFIGSELVRLLVKEKGSEIVVVDNLVNGRAENLAGLSAEQVRLVIGDVRDEGLMHELLRDVGVVYHLACLGVRHSIHSPDENHEVNASATLKLLGTARQAGVARFVYVSTSEVYGTARWVPMSEEHPTFPMTVYGSSKLAGECYTRAYFETYDYPTVVVRPFNAYGPRCHHEGDSGEVIPKFMLRGMAGLPMVIFGDGSQTRDFTYVSDTARGIMLAGFAEKAIGQTINIGSSHEIAIKDLAQEIAEVLGRERADIIYEQPRPGDVLRLYADAARAKALLDFEPRVGFREGLTRLRNWYLSQGVAPETLLEKEIVLNWQVQESYND